MTKNNKNKGYTIIETMIAISLFLVVTMAGMGALLNANLVHQKSASMREIMDNLSFVMEDMSRNLRTGYNYHCFVNGDRIPPSPLDAIQDPVSCASGGAIAFEHQDGQIDNSSDQWIYKIESPDGVQPFSISKSTDSGGTWVQLNPSEVEIDAISGFSVLGAEPPPGDVDQPFVTIKLVGKITFKDVVTPFSLQTSVSQRAIDI
jgi:prepilin-type N-terminal cleavage/methylation domain-containing protein